MPISSIAQDDVVRALSRVQQAVAQACVRNSRLPDSVTLVAASKSIAAPVVAQALEAGHCIFGENRIQETKSKWSVLRGNFRTVELHLIGPLQTNKAKDAVALFDVLQSVDRKSLAKAIATEVQRQGRSPKVFVQVNVGEERQKSGIAPDLANSFLHDCRKIYNLDVVGIMGIPPVSRIPGPYFAKLRSIAHANGLRYMSMGMSNDFEQAIADGATHVRVGRAIFGARVSQAVPIASR